MENEEIYGLCDQHYAYKHIPVLLYSERNCVLVQKYSSRECFLN